MHRQSQEELEAAARRRLELLGRELEQAGLPRVEEPPEEWPPERASTSAPPGRHLGPPPGVLTRFGGWLGDRLPETFRGTVGLRPGPALVVLALAGLAVVVAIVVTGRSSGAGEPVPRAAPTVVRSGSAPLVGASPAAHPSLSASPPGSAGTVTIDVAGKVRRPGVATLPAGSRVVDALHHAGGARGRVDLSGLNLARVLVDGEHIVVGRPAEPGGIAASVSSGAPAPSGQLVNLNTATLEQLDTLPGVGPVTAQKILDWRTEHGAFSSVDELLEVDGIGEKTMSDLAPLVTL